MPIRDRQNLWGAWAFLIGVILAIATGILSFGELNPIILAVLAVLGFIVGFINVSDRDLHTFLLASVSIVLVTYAGIASISNISFGDIPLGKYISSALGALLVMLVPATIIVALKSLFSISQR